MSMKLIGTVTVGAGGAATIAFSGIPSTETDLVLSVSLAPSAGNNNVLLSFNGSSTSFSSQYIYGTGSATTGGTRSDNVFGALAGLSTTVFSNAQIYIPNYAGATNKSFAIDTVTENNATVSFQWLHSGQWSNTAAINSITLTAADSFVQNSVVSLYTINKVASA